MTEVGAWTGDGAQPGDSNACTGVSAWTGDVPLTGNGGAQAGDIMQTAQSDDGGPPVGDGPTHDGEGVSIILPSSFSLSVTWPSLQTGGGV